MDKEDFFLCFAIGRRGVSHAWGKGETQEKAISECRLAVFESHFDNAKPSKLRHKPYAYIVGHNDWWTKSDHNWLEVFDLGQLNWTKESK